MSSNNSFKAISCLYFTTAKSTSFFDYIGMFSILSLPNQTILTKKIIILLQQPYTRIHSCVVIHEKPIAALSLPHSTFISRDSLRIWMAILKNHVIINFYNFAVSENLREQNFKTWRRKNFNIERYSQKIARPRWAATQTLLILIKNERRVV